MTMHSEIPDDLGEPLDQHSDTLDGIRLVPIESNLAKIRWAL